MGEIVLYIDELSSSSFICRICHEAEFESCKSLETPCACSGTVKFAHRDCVQRWCDEKGNTVCEICLQKFEPGYTSSPPPKKTQLIDSTVTIRRSLEVPRNEEEEEENEGEINDECDESEADAKSSCCRTLALTFTALLLMRHLFAVVTGGAGAYPFSLLTVVIAKASGILVPMYILVRILATLQNNIRHHYYQNANTDEDEDEDEVEHQEQHTNTEIQV